MKQKRKKEKPTKKNCASDSHVHMIVIVNETKFWMNIDENL